MTTGTRATPPDPFAPERALTAGGDLREFNDAGVLAAADIQLARRLATLGGESDPEVVLAVALAVRAPRLGHAYVDLDAVADDAVEGDEASAPTDLSWPEGDRWRDLVTASALVAAAAPGSADEPGRPLRLLGSRLYLERYWREERDVGAGLLGLANGSPPAVDGARLADGLQRLFGDDEVDQREGARLAIERRLVVIAGGPGTGKTTTIACIAALAAEQRDPDRLLLALAAPTGKAAARLQEAVRTTAADLPVDAAVRAQLEALKASTLHRLLGWRRGHHDRFRHDRTRHLPHDVVIVDEASMLSLTLTARLLEALRPDARLILVGDPGQLSPIEVGTVLHDVVDAGDGSGAGIVRLRRTYRYGAEIGALAQAVRDGDADAAVAVLGAGDDAVGWIATDVGEDADLGPLASVRSRVLAAGEAVAAAARGGRAEEALEALGSFRILCAHRYGPAGVARWLREVESWLATDGSGAAAGFPIGRPLLITENDYELQLFNGDTGVVVAGQDDRPVAVFDHGTDLLRVAPARLGGVATAYAMTIHKSQGTQFDVAAVVLPSPESRALSRELLYTAVTRARRQVVVVGSEASVRAAVSRSVARASGLPRLLRGE